MLEWGWTILKTLGVLAFIVFLIYGINSCAVVVEQARQQKLDRVESVLGGTHYLHRLVERENTNSSFSGGFFMFVGAVGGGSSTEVSVKFAWQMNNGDYSINSLPLEKVRVRLDEEQETPSIEFFTDLSSGIFGLSSTSEPNDMIPRFVKYAVVTCRPENWPASPIDLLSPLS